MTKEEKELLLKDLCARLPYGVKLLHTPTNEITNLEMISNGVIDGNIHDLIENFKPYLFPLSSMTDEQCYKLALICSGFQDCWKYIKTPIPLTICNFEQIDWFHKNHFDYRGLIEKGLAIDATRLNK